VKKQKGAIILGLVLLLSAMPLAGNNNQTYSPWHTVGTATATATTISLLNFFLSKKKRLAIAQLIKRQHRTATAMPTKPIATQLAGTLLLGAASALAFYKAGQQASEPLVSGNTREYQDMYSQTDEIQTITLVRQTTGPTTMEMGTQSGPREELTSRHMVGSLTINGDLLPQRKPKEVCSTFTQTEEAKKAEKPRIALVLTAGQSSVAIPPIAAPKQLLTVAYATTSTSIPIEEASKPSVEKYEQGTQTEAPAETSNSWQYSTPNRPPRHQGTPVSLQKDIPKPQTPGAVGTLAWIVQFNEDSRIKLRTPQLRATPTVHSPNATSLRTPSSTLSHESSNSPGIDDVHIKALKATLDSLAPPPSTRRHSDPGPHVTMALLLHRQNDVGYKKAALERAALRYHSQEVSV